MNEQTPSRSDDSSDAGWDHTTATTTQFAPVERYPGEHFPPERYPTERFPTEQFPPVPPTELYPPVPVTDQCPTVPASENVERLAHDGGLPYGITPAAPYRQGTEFVPHHLASPTAGQGFGDPARFQQYTAYGMSAQEIMPHPYPMQQTVFVIHGGGRRVNHPLHLILTILSFGLWLPVWAVLAIANS
ncbi:MULTISPECIES: hypothetical protein [unclassified Dietzia]|uniref:hypothetical protein n=1 Tax=unclassified Dietzia TaxID=2617939 RepID=UPI000D20B380|nr:MULTISPECIES: hypothetical protein [unclassified Dietzia]AVZ40235.1 hypothetical protein CT688_12935 [Dietzia sp. JS16-p6b]QGW25699.1 hypothetical protein GJR88_04107 [Dietzia sp. DQ12-45-1b]